MADSASESDSSSVADGPIMQPPTMPPSPITRDQWQKRIDSLQQQNRVLKAEVETCKLRIKSLQEENHNLRQASVNIQARAEQEEEYISNTLMKKIHTLKKEKESLALNYEQEEECLTNDLSRKLNQLRNEKVELEQTLEQEQEAQVNKLMRKIEKLETETQSKQNDLDRVRKEKVELENTLEQEQEALVNKLWKRMDKLEAEKRVLQAKLEQPISAPPSPADFPRGDDTASHLSSHILNLRSEVERMKRSLVTTQHQHESRTAQYAQEERLTREENRRLTARLQQEVERREALCRHLSESESSLELEDGRLASPVPRPASPLPRCPHCHLALPSDLAYPRLAHRAPGFKPPPPPGSVSPMHVAPHHTPPHLPHDSLLEPAPPSPMDVTKN